jgi:menaquinone-specific isochorismate synthase
VTAVEETIKSLRQSLSAEAAKASATPFLHRTETIDALDPLEWLKSQPGGSRLYWQGRNGEIVAGTGFAHTIKGKASDCAAQFLELYKRAGGNLGNIRYFGGLAFDNAAIDELWAPFDRCHFHLPEVLVTRRPDGACELSFFQVNLPSAPISETTLVPDNGHDTQPDSWQKGVNAVLGAIANGEIDKAVLAARSSLQLPPDFAPFDLLEDLRDHAKDAFVFAFEPSPGTVFLGASPERLYRRDGTRIVTEALAGTRPRGATAADDAQLAAELLGSSKDRNEQQLVLRELVSALTPFCETLEVREEDPVLLPLETVQHLVQHLEGTIHPGVLDHQIIRAIHPTPAVGGRPREEALDLIHANETFSRGWYAAPVGWLSPAAAEFAVAIRSALYREESVATQEGQLGQAANNEDKLQSQLDGTARSLYVFAGAGIVSGSVPDKEWDEVQQKQSLIRKLARK